VAFFISRIIPVFDNVFQMKNARRETGHFVFISVNRSCQMIFSSRNAA
jgi:hypothetical protein